MESIFLTYGSEISKEELMKIFTSGKDVTVKMHWPSPDPDNKFTGGAYSYTFWFYLWREGLWLRECYTSADFEYCKYLDEFKSCYNCEHFDRSSSNWEDWECEFDRDETLEKEGREWGIIFTADEMVEMILASIKDDREKDIEIEITIS